jgi:hypothetical protein
MAVQLTHPHDVTGSAVVDQLLEPLCKRMVTQDAVLRHTQQLGGGGSKA